MGELGLTPNAFISKEGEDYKEIEKFINEYCKPFNLEKKEKIE